MKRTREEVELAALERDVAGRDTKPGGLVRLTSVPTLSNRLLAPRVGSLFQTYPDIELDLIAEPATLSVIRREADIALRNAEPGSADLIGKKLGVSEAEKLLKRRVDFPKAELQQLRARAGR